MDKENEKMTLTHRSLPCHTHELLHFIQSDQVRLYLVIGYLTIELIFRPPSTTPAFWLTVIPAGSLISPTLWGFPFSFEPPDAHL